MVKDGPIDHLLKDFADGLDWLSGEIDKPEFQKKIVGFVQEIGSLAGSLGGMVSGLAKFARWLGVGTSFSSWTAGEHGVSSLTGRGGETSLEGRRAHSGGSTGRFTHGRLGGGGGKPPEGKLRARGLRLMDDLIAKGWTPASAAMAAGNAEAESNINPSGPPGDLSKGWEGRAVGMFQDRLDRRTALQAFGARHPEMSAWDANVEYYNQERQQQGLKHLYDMSRAGEFSHITEGYGDSTEGKRVRMSHAWLKTYNESHAKKSKVTVNSVPGGNTSLGSAAAAAGSP